MDFASFLLLCIITVALAAVVCWLLDKFVPTHPPAVNWIIWGVAVFIILWNLAQATGILSHSPQIPRL